MVKRGRLWGVLAVMGVAALVAGFHYKSDFGTYRIVEVYDGDTIAVDMEGVPEKIRMIGADTPETVDPRKEVQCFGPEASAYTHAHLRPDMRVRLVADPLSTDRDRYDRLLRYVYLQDGTLYEQRLIELGYARAYTGFPFSKMPDFKASQSEAQVTKRGLWAGCPS
jgi:micrococcal nuclease